MGKGTIGSGMSEEFTREPYSPEEIDRMWNSLFEVRAFVSTCDESKVAVSTEVLRADIERQLCLLSQLKHTLRRNCELQQRRDALLERIAYLTKGAELEGE